MRKLLVQQPRLAETLSETLATRRSALEAEITAARTNHPAAHTEGTKESLLARLRQFFQL